METRKIVYTGPFDPGLRDGVSGSTFDLLNFLRKRGHESGIISLMHDNSQTRKNLKELAGFPGISITSQEKTFCRYTQGGVDVHYEILPGFSRTQVLGGHPTVLKHIMSAVQESLDACFFTVDTDASSLMAHHFLKTLCVFFVRSPAVSIRFFLKHPIYREMAKQRTVFTVSPFAQSELKTRLDIEALVWPSFIDPGRVRGQERNPPRKALGYYSAGWHKGDRIVERLIREMPDYSFFLMGDEDTIGTYPHVTRLKNIPQPRDFYRRISLLLVPSLLPEGHPRTIIEASYNGIPVIANRIGGIPDALGKSGIMIDIDPSEEAMIHRYKTEITRLLENPREYETYRQGALERASEYEKAIVRISADYADRFFLV